MPRVISRNLPYISIAKYGRKLTYEDADAVVRLLEATRTLPTAYVHAELHRARKSGSLGRVLPDFRALCSVPAVGHGETVVHEIAGRVEHVVKQFRNVSAQVFRHFFVGLLQSGDTCDTCVFRNIRGPCTLLAIRTRSFVRSSHAIRHQCVPPDDGRKRGPIPQILRSHCWFRRNARRRARRSNGSPSTDCRSRLPAWCRAGRQGVSLTFA